MNEKELLKEYQETGLTPAQIDDVIAEWCVLKTVNNDYRRLGSIDYLKKRTEADKEGRCLVFPAGFEFENGIYVLCGDISKVKEDKKGYSIKSEKAYFLIKNEEKYILVSVANMPENLLEYYETQIGMNNAKKEEAK